MACPSCGYSMVGLESCQCPECGAAFTIDQLIRSQDYAALRPQRLGEPPARNEPALPVASRELSAPVQP